MLQRLIAAGLLAALAQPAHAADDADTALYGGIGLRLGTGGLGIDYTYGINRYVDVRAGYYFGSIDTTAEEDDIEYDAELEFSALSAMVDIKPFKGGFRISAGIHAPPELALYADGMDEYEVGDRRYTGDLVLDGKADLGSAAPYLGLGWGGTTNDRGLGVSFDIGVIFAKSPDVSLDVTGRACDSTAAPCDPDGASGFDVSGSDPRAQQFQADKEQEVRNLEEDAKDFDLWPVLMIGLHYRF
ncbi:MAG: hypothetical protein ACPHN2_06590 [Sinimarinibacterium flocculans]|uniref:Outer membrane protein with beta-barrel domain n=1 Tax=Sinimarinibacterium flocculans TaxID=985250 RepID=A0A318EFQ7_9GAMM|nr:hypothetical protein [Sinimarinibacterium flocculans]PXV69556.1 hypothetical protein C8D93_103130 [Sinimarinibacterium flocculans]